MDIVFTGVVGGNNVSYNIQQLGSLNVDEAELDEDPQFGKHPPSVACKVDNSVGHFVLIMKLHGTEPIF